MKTQLSSHCLGKPNSGSSDDLPKPRFDRPIFENVRRFQDCLEQCLGSPYVERLKVLEERTHSRGKRGNEFLSAVLLRDPRGELRLTPRKPWRNEWWRWGRVDPPGQPRGKGSAAARSRDPVMAI